MIYSRWNPAGGLYDHFEGPTLQGLNDDLPEPQMPAPTALGVPSVECGRPMPAGVVHVGTSDVARGLITHPAGVQLFGTTIDVQKLKDGALWFVTGCLAATVAWALWRRRT